MLSPDHPTRQELARDLLLYKMKEYSEDGYCAGWLDGLEWELWEAAEQPRPTGPFITSRECRQLAEIARGWWVYGEGLKDDAEEPTFVSLDRWQQIRASGKRPPVDPLDL